MQVQLKIKQYQKVLTDYVTQLAAEYNNSLGSSKTYQAVTDTVNNRFLLMNVGWYKGKFRYHVLFHLEIHPETGNIWVQQNYTEILLDVELEKLAAVPKEHLVIGFLPKVMREHSDYTVA